MTLPPGTETRWGVVIADSWLSGAHFYHIELDLEPAGAVVPRYVVGMLPSGLVEQSLAPDDAPQEEEAK